MKAKFQVTDMHCPNCAMHLEALEDELEGVRRIQASYQKQTMEVEFDETVIHTDEIIQAAAEIGYHPVLIAS